MHGNGRVGVLKQKHVRKAVNAVSKHGKFRYTLRNLYYKLLRDGAFPVPVGDPVEGLRQFKQELEVYEKSNGPLPGRIRHADLPPEPDLSALHSDVIDYTVRRILVFDRPETFLVFALNGFHRKIEIGLLIWPDYPRHAWKMHERHSEESQQRTFYLIHDCNRAGYEMKRNVKKAVDTWGLDDRVVDIGLRFRQAGNLGLTIQERHAESATAGEDRMPVELTEGDYEEAQLLLPSGNYVHLEELSPLQMMRWAYGRIAKRPQDLGFG